MKKSRFTESQIVAILKEGEAGVAVAQLTRTGSAQRPTTTRSRSTVVRVSRSSSGCVSWRPKTPSWSGCMPIWRWRIPPSRTCLAENSDAVGQA